MATDTELVISAIDGLRDQMNERFNTFDATLTYVKSTAEKLEDRVRKVETESTRRKTLEAAFGAALTFVGWEHFKAAWTALIR